MTTLHCAICGERFEPDTDHVWIKASQCRECGRELGAGYLCDRCDTIEVVES